MTGWDLCSQLSVNFSEQKGWVTTGACSCSANKSTFSSTAPNHGFQIQNLLNIQEVQSMTGSEEKSNIHQVVIRKILFVHMNFSHYTQINEWIAPEKKLASKSKRSDHVTTSCHVGCRRGLTRLVRIRCCRRWWDLVPLIVPKDEITVGILRVSRGLVMRSPWDIPEENHLKNIKNTFLRAKWRICGCWSNPLQCFNERITVIFWSALLTHDWNLGLLEFLFDSCDSSTCNSCLRAWWVGSSQSCACYRYINPACQYCRQ